MTIYGFTECVVVFHNNEKCVQNEANTVFKLDAKFMHLKTNSYVLALYSPSPPKLWHVFEERDMIRAVGKLTAVYATHGFVKDVRTNRDAFFDIYACILSDGAQTARSLLLPPFNFKAGVTVSMEYFELPINVADQMAVTNRYKVYKMMPYEQQSQPTLPILDAPRPIATAMAAVQQAPAAGNAPGPPTHPAAYGIMYKAVKWLVVDDLGTIWVNNAGLVTPKMQHAFKKGLWVLLDVLGSLEDGSNRTLVGDKPILARNVLDTKIDRRGNVVVSGEGKLLTHHKEGEGYIYSEKLGPIVFEKGRVNDFLLEGSKPGSSWIRFQATLRRHYENADSAWQANHVEVLPDKGHPVGLHSLIVSFCEDMGNGHLLCTLERSLTDEANGNKVKESKEAASHVLVTSNVYRCAIRPDQFAIDVMEKGGYLSVLALATKTSIPTFGEISFRTLFAETYIPPFDEAHQEKLMQEIYKNDNKAVAKVAKVEEIPEEVDPPDDELEEQSDNAAEPDSEPPELRIVEDWIVELERITSESEPVPELRYADDEHDMIEESEIVDLDIVEDIIEDEGLARGVSMSYSSSSVACSAAGNLSPIHNDMVMLAERNMSRNARALRF